MKLFGISFPDLATLLDSVGIIVSVASFIIGLFIKSEINKLKTNYIFDKRIKEHIKNLNKSASILNSLLNDYDDNRNSINTELSLCISELEDIVSKVGYRQGLKSRRLVSFLKSRITKQFIIRNSVKPTLWTYLFKYIERLYVTTYDDIWIIYNKLFEIMRQMENIKKNKSKSL